MREIVFDTETTGLDFLADRIVEIGCVELVNHIPTGREFHRYLNPERPMSNDAYSVHGLSDAFLRDQPRFAEIVDEFLAFIEGGVLIAHNAEFDMGFLNAELARHGRPGITGLPVVDTLALARRRHPAGPNSLDALCSRYGIDLSRRTLHGALLDASLLAEVYVELIGGRQASLLLGEALVASPFGGPILVPTVALPLRPMPRPILVTAEELDAHRSHIARLGAPPIWQKYWPVAEAAE